MNLQEQQALEDLTKELENALRAPYKNISHWNRARSKERKEKKKLSAAILSWWNGGQCNGVLDLSDFTGRTIRDIPNAAVIAIQSRITELTLPRSLNDSTNPIPSWLSGLTALTRLEAPNFQGSNVSSAILSS
ncbi:MAG: hypothetical protein V4568_14480 [Pseudomonadota bacterium]